MGKATRYISQTSSLAIAVRKFLVITAKHNNYTMPPSSHLIYS